MSDDDTKAFIEADDANLVDKLGLGPLPKMHPREEIVREAKRKLDKLIHDWRREPACDLTVAEELKIVMWVSSDYIQSVLRSAIRIERHGDSDKPGGIE